MSLRVIGRGTIDRITPDSTSAEIAGAAMKTAAKVSTKLNMKKVRIVKTEATWLRSSWLSRREPPNSGSR